MKIAIFWPNWIGDAVMATAAVRALRQHFASADFIGVLKPYIGGVLEGSSWMDRLIFLDNRGPWELRWPAVAQQLRKEQVDLAILFPNSFRAALVAWLGRCKNRIGYSRYGRSLLLSEKLAPVRNHRGRLEPSPVIDAYNRLAVRAGCPNPGYRMELFTTSENEQAADLVWKQAGFTRQTQVVCLNPGAAFGSAKYWPAEYFAQLARWLAQTRDRGVLVSQTRPAICRTAIPFEPISPLDRNQAAARPFHGHEWRRSRHIPNCCCVYGSRPLPDCQHFPWSSAPLPRSQCFVWSSAGF